jgi:ketosteroid isomerase-like protein
MSQENVEMVRATYEAANRGDWDSFFAGVDPNVELKAPDRMMRGRRYRGIREVREFFEDLLEPFEEVVVQPEKFFDAGDRLVVFVLLSSRPIGSSATIEIRIGHLWTMRDGKATRLEIFPEREKALEAVGLSEQDAHAEGS